MTKVTYGRKAIKQSPPKWISMITAIVILLISSKAVLIGSFPGATDEIKEVAGKWFDYVFNGIGVVFGILSILTGADKDSPLNTKLPRP